MENNKREKLRQCIGCRRVRPKQEMLRVIRTPEGAVEIDRTGRKNGRGAYLCVDEPACLKAALKHRSLERALKTGIPADLAEKLEKELDHGC